MDAVERVKLVVRALERYRAEESPVYDEVLSEISQRADRDGSLGKADIGGLVLWKRLDASTAWAKKLMKTPDKTVREATGLALERARADAPLSEAAAGARSALTGVSGFGVGDALASAVIFALAPDRMAVYDRRAHRGLGLLGLNLTNSRGRYGRYMGLVADVMAEASEQGRHLRTRDVDLALYTLGGGRDA